MSGERALRPCGKPVATDADWERFDGGEGEHLCWCDNGSCDQGYTWEDRAVSLTARLAEVEQALRPFAEYAEGLDDALPDSVAVAARSHTGPGFDRHEQVSFGDFRRARAVLDKGEPDG